MRRIVNKKGITLIALVITIIVLLILAGITISLTIGQDGIINIAEQAGKNSIEAEEKEEELLISYENKIGDYISSTRNDNSDKLDYGIATIPSGTGWRTVYVEFNKTYENAPIVITQPMQSNIDITNTSAPIGGYTQWEVDNVTTEGFYINLYNNAFPNDLNLYWISIGK